MSRTIVIARTFHEARDLARDEDMARSEYQIVTDPYNVRGIHGKRIIVCSCAIVGDMARMLEFAETVCHCTVEWRSH